jgi:hypothetical protein
MESLTGDYAESGEFFFSPRFGLSVGSVAQNPDGFFLSSTF